MGRTVGVYDSVNKWTWYVHGGSRVAEFVPAPGQQSNLSGAPVITLSPSNFSAGKPVYTTFSNSAMPLSYFVYDHLGSTRVTYTTMVTAGVPFHNVKTIHDYKVYGKVFREYISGRQDKYLYTGYERDHETQLDYAKARMMDGVRFMGVDPLRDKFPGWSSYSYCMGNPVNLVDLSGRSPKDIYSLDENGKIKFEKAAPGPDILMTLSAYKKGQTPNARNSVTVPGDELKDRIEQTFQDKTSGEKFDATVMNFKDEQSAKGVFEFAVKNTNVEFSLTTIQLGATTLKQTTVATSHLEVSEYFSPQLMLGSVRAGSTVISSAHNHTHSRQSENGIQMPSPYPSSFDESVRDAVKALNPNASFSIFTRSGNYKTY